MPTEIEDRPLPSPDDVLSPAFRRALDTVPVSVVVVDPSGTISLANSAAERMFAYERDRLKDRPIEVLVPAGYRSGHADHVAAGLNAPWAGRALGGGRELTALRSDGTEFPVEIGLGPLPTSGGTWMVVSIVDLTEWKRLAIEYRDQRERAQAYLEAASEGLITVDASGSIEMVNKATERIFGYNRSELLGQPLDIIIPEVHRRSHAVKLESYFANPKLRTMGTGLDLFGRRKDGTQFPAEVGLNVARLGDRTFGIAFVTDISEKRRLQEQSAVLGTLVDLQRQLSSSGNSEAASNESDPLTGLGTRAMFERALKIAGSEPKGLYAVACSVRRMQQMSARFGTTTANRILAFASQYIANALQGEGDELFRWEGATFVALVRRGSSVARVRREFTEAAGNRLEYMVERAGGDSLLVISLDVKVLPLDQASPAELLAELERVVRATPPD